MSHVGVDDRLAARSEQLLEQADTLRAMVASTLEPDDRQHVEVDK